MIRAVCGAAILVASCGSALAQQPATAGAPVGTTAAAPAPADALEPRLITIDDVKAKMAANTKMIILDARSAITGDMVKGAVHVPLDRLEAWAKDVPKDALIVAYCACGSEGTSKAAVRKLAELGFTNSFALKGGILGWQTAGMPTEPFKP